MKVLLVSANTEEAAIPVLPLGLAFVASSLIHVGHDVKFLDLMGTAEPSALLKAEIEGFNPGAIGVSVRNVDNQSMTDTKFLLKGATQTVEDCRESSDAPIILGGAGFSVFPQAILDYLKADMGILGEGETSLPSLLDRLAKGENPAGVPGLYLPNQGQTAAPCRAESLDDYPFPPTTDFLWAREPEGGYPIWLPIQTRRGCPMDCNYCSTAAIEGRTIRSHSAERVVDALAQYVKAGINHFFFVDNIFNHPIDYAKSLCELIIKTGLDIKWRAIIYPTEVDDELASLLAQAGCFDIGLGFETGSEKILETMLKKFSLDDVVSIAQKFKKHGIRQMGFLLLGGPDETRETVKQSLKFAESLNLELMKLTAGIRIYPDTPLAGRAVKDGICTEGDDLLLPKFYMTDGLGSWLEQTISQYVGKHKYWMS